MATDLSCQQFLKMRADWSNPCLIHRHREAKHFGRLPFFYRDQSLSAHRCRWSLGSRPAWRSGPFAQGWPGWAVWAGTSPNGDPKALACRGARILAKQHKAPAEKEAASAMAMAMAMREKGNRGVAQEDWWNVYIGGKERREMFCDKSKETLRVQSGCSSQWGGKKKKKEKLECKQARRVRTNRKGLWFTCILHR